MIEVVGLSKSYQELQILKGVDLTILPGESVCIRGASGAGKSTLLHLMGTLDTPTAGQVVVRGESVTDMTDLQLAKFRNLHMGFVFQFHHLLSEFTALENVMMPARIAGLSVRESKDKAEQWLKRVGLWQRASHYPSQLSGGERQRVAIARALCLQPELLFADEPTGNLDHGNAESIENLFFELHQQLGITLVVVTHNDNFASRFNRQLTLIDGRLNLN